MTTNSPLKLSRADARAIVRTLRFVVTTDRKVQANALRLTNLLTVMLEDGAP